MKNFDEMVTAVRKSSGTTPFVVQRTRDGHTYEFTANVDVAATQRWTARTPTRKMPVRTPAPPRPRPPPSGRSG